MRKKEFFKELSRRLPNDKYKERFLEELNEHFEDALADEQWKAKVVEDEVVKRLGEPTFIYLYYQVFMHNQRWYLYAEVFFWSLVSVFIYGPTIASTTLIDGPDNLLIKGVIWLLSLAGSAGLYYLFYSFAYSRLKRLHAFHESLQAFLLKSFGAIVPFLLLIGMIGAAYLTDANEKQDLFYAPMAALNYIVGLITAPRE